MSETARTKTSMAASTFHPRRTWSKAWEFGRKNAITVQTASMHRLYGANISARRSQAASALPRWATSAWK